MVNAYKQIVIIQPGGRVVVASEELPEGRQAEVIVLVDRDARRKSYANLFGSGKGAFSTPREADEFLRQERERWED